MPHVPGLRSCYAKVGRLVYFGRMLDKIRLHAAGKLPAEYQKNLGDAQTFVLEGRCCRFLGIRYADLRERTLAGGTDEELLALHEALNRLSVEHPEKAELVKLRYFAGLTADQAAAALGISPSTADRHWTYARAWLGRALMADSRSCLV